MKNINVSEEVFYQITELYNTENKKKEMRYQGNHYKQVKKGDKFDVGLGTIIFYFKKIPVNNSSFGACHHPHQAS